MPKKDEQKRRTKKNKQKYTFQKYGKYTQKYIRRQLTKLTSPSSTVTQKVTVKN